MIMAEKYSKRVENTEGEREIARFQMIQEISLRNQIQSDLCLSVSCKVINSLKGTCFECCKTIVWNDKVASYYSHVQIIAFV